jgi:hypothetical protein
MYTESDWFQICDLRPWGVNPTMTLGAGLLIKELEGAIMKPVVAIFTNPRKAESALKDLRTQGVPERDISLLAPSSSEASLRRLPTDEGEQPGMGEAVGAVVGTGLGASGGAFLGAATSALIPGIGPVVAIGVAAAGLLGIVGAFGGAAAGGALEDALTVGIPKDEWFVYEDALRQGRTVLAVVTANDARAASLRATLSRHGAESVDAARDRWWLGLSSAEEEHYGGNGRFKSIEPRYRRGFEAALHPEMRGRAYESVTALLRECCPEDYEDPAFRRGYERGLEYSRDKR